MLLFLWTTYPSAIPNGSQRGRVSGAGDKTHAKPSLGGVLGAASSGRW